MKQAKNLPVTAAEAAQIVTELRAKGWKAKDAAKVGAARNRATIFKEVAEMHNVSAEQILRSGIGGGI